MSLRQEYLYLGKEIPGTSFQRRDDAPVRMRKIDFFEVKK